MHFLDLNLNPRLPRESRILPGSKSSERWWNKWLYCKVGGGFLCSLPRLNPLPIQGEWSRSSGPREPVRLWFNFVGSRKVVSRGDRDEKVGSPRPRSREGSRGDRNWAVSEGLRSAAGSPFPPGTEPHPARRAGPQAARAARASPRAKGPAPEIGRGRGETRPAPQAAARGSRRPCALP